MKFENTAVLYDLLTKSGYYFRANQQRYEVNISEHSKTICLGSYQTIQEAKQVIYNYKYTRLINALKNKNDILQDCKILNSTYVVCESGNIYNLHGNEIIGHIDRNGYRNVIINGKTLLMHRIIAQAFIPNPDNLPQINHKDGVKTNNNIINLEWCNRSENILHAYRTGLEKKVLGEDHHNNKLTEEQVIYIKKNYKPRDPINGATALGKKFGVTRCAIQDVAREKSWGWLNAI